MSRYLFSWINNLKIRWKMMVVVLPLVVVPIFLLGALIGYVATEQAYQGLTTSSKADLDHMAGFTLDLIKFPIEAARKGAPLDEATLQRVAFAWGPVPAVLIVISVVILGAYSINKRRHAEIAAALGRAPAPAE